MSSLQLYATLAPLVLGIVAVIYAHLELRRMRSNKKQTAEHGSADLRKQYHL